MLPAPHRLTEGEGFRRAVRSGRRAGGPLLVVHLAALSPSTTPLAPARIGFVVSRAVGNAVVRNRVRRRLRHLVRERLDVLPGGATVVVRALPAAAAATGPSLAAELDRCLGRLTTPAGV